MACPFFLPEAPLDAAWAPAPRLPLGDAYSGTCQVRPDAPFAPGRQRLLDSCNCGYARGRCERFPPDYPTDAVRFSIDSEAKGQVHLVYVIEAAHVPAEHGPLDYQINESRLEGAGDRDLLAAQARAFLAGYLRRRK